MFCPLLGAKVRHLWCVRREFFLSQTFTNWFSGVYQNSQIRCIFAWFDFRTWFKQQQNNSVKHNFLSSSKVKENYRLQPSRTRSMSPECVCVCVFLILWRIIAFSGVMAPVSFCSCFCTVLFSVFPIHNNLNMQPRTSLAHTHTHTHPLQTKKTWAHICAGARVQSWTHIQSNQNE